MPPRTSMVNMLFGISAQAHLLPVAIFLAMLTVGMELRVAQFRDLARNPAIPLKATLIHTLTFPALAVLAVLTVLWMDWPVAEVTILGVLLIAACPSGGFSNILTLMARANLPLSITLTAISSVFSMLTVPLLMTFFGLLLTQMQGSVGIPIGSILTQLALLVLLPIGAGMFLSAKLSSVTDARMKRWQSQTQLLLYVVIALQILENWELMTQWFVPALPWSVGLCAGNIAACYGLANLSGLNQEDAITVALEGSIRNLGVAFLIAANTMERMDIAVLPTAYFLTVLVISILFAKNWRRLPGFQA